MANTRSARKRARQTTTRTLANRRALTAVKNRLKEVRLALKGGKKDEATAAAQKFVSSIDKAVKTENHGADVAAKLGELGVEKKKS